MTLVDPLNGLSFNNIYFSRISAVTLGAWRKIRSCFDAALCVECFESVTTMLAFENFFTVNNNHTLCFCGNRR